MNALKLEFQEKIKSVSAFSTNVLLLDSDERDVGNHEGVFRAHDFPRIQ